MPKFIISQTVDIDVQWVMEAENVEDAIQKARDGALDNTKIINVDHLSWDEPYDACPIPEDHNELKYLTQEQLLVYSNAGIL